ncbi:MAG: hypothetical protein KGH98_03595 [Candidatus Micrarchaeota archaeon]|nr:hypothetical protein [Candidatus Micrarchaeota archaeon]
MQFERTEGGKTVSVSFDGAANLNTLKEAIELSLELYPNLKLIEIDGPHTDCGALKVATKVLLGIDNVSDSVKGGLVKPLEVPFKKIMAHGSLDVADDSPELKEIRDRMEEENPANIKNNARRILDDNGRNDITVNSSLHRTVRHHYDHPVTSVVIITAPSTRTANEVVESVGIEHDSEWYRPYIVQTFSVQSSLSAVEVAAKLGINKFILDVRQRDIQALSDGITRIFSSLGQKGPDITLYPLDSPKRLEEAKRRSRSI